MINRSFGNMKNKDMVGKRILTCNIHSKIELQISPKTLETAYMQCSKNVQRKNGIKFLLKVYPKNKNQINRSKRMKYNVSND